jgi:glyceraldehyde 3-phosphate dehydrogenase
MSVRVGINGFGRIGRLTLRAGLNRPEFTVVHINEAKGGAVTAAHLLEFDSVHGRWPVQISAAASLLTVDEQQMAFSDQEEPGAVRWDDSGVNIVLECSGKFRTSQALQPYFERGVRKVIVAAPIKKDALNIVMGINDHLYDPEIHDIITAASCTTNCLAPVVKVVHENLGIHHGVITTIHDATNTQTIVDQTHQDLRRARSALLSLVPTTTGSAIAIGLIYPELEGKLNGIAVRVPLLNASLTDCVFEVQRQTTVAEVNGFLKDAACGPLKGILGFEERPLVSVDFVNDPRSAIVDGPSTMVVDGTQVKILAWYDNEWGYANRLVELAAKVASSMSAGQQTAVTG